MASAHAGMNISPGEFIALLDDVLAAMKTLNCGEREQAEVLKILYDMKADVLCR